MAVDVRDRAAAIPANADVRAGRPHPDPAPANLTDGISAIFHHRTILMLVS